MAQAPALEKFEAKGGGSILGSRKGLDGRQVQQGTPEYRDSIIEKKTRLRRTTAMAMIKSSPNKLMI